jgi:hypothetical protein
VHQSRFGEVVGGVAEIAKSIKLGTSPRGSISMRKEKPVSCVSSAAPKGSGSRQHFWSIVGAFRRSQMSESLMVHRIPGGGG